ncbi:Major Facilitator [Gracilaria domingensis]|nr:Major Facilitator [Gracilaria domingensis]
MSGTDFSCARPNDSLALYPGGRLALGADRCNIQGLQQRKFLCSVVSIYELRSSFGLCHRGKTAAPTSTTRLLRPIAPRIASMAPATEISPLLPTNSQRTNAGTHSYSSGKEILFDEPQCASCPRLKEWMQSTLSPSGHGHPIHHQLQSPSLLLQIEKSLERGLSFLVHKLRLIRLFPKNEAEKHQVDSTQAFVHTIFGLAILTMLVMTTVSPTLVLYMNHVNFTSPTNITPYVTASAIASAVPIASNIIFGRVASSIGPANALSLIGFTSAIGIGLVLAVRSTVLVFFIGYALYSCSNSMRIIRLSILSQIVPENKRTTVLATHALMTPIGALMGPITWIGLSRYQGSSQYGQFTLDRFSLAYSIAFIILTSIGLLAAVALRKLPTTEGHQSTQSYIEPTQVVVRENGLDITVNLNKFRTRVFAYFCTVMLCVNMSSGIYMTAFQPVLVNVFRVTDAKLGFVFELIAVFAIVPPLLVAFLSRHLMDRQIMVIGLGSKLIGMLLFMPLFGPVREWQVIIGFMLIIKASIFFSTASMSLFTKVLGTLSNSALIGLLASGSSVGPAVAQLLISDHIVQFFGSLKFALFSFPAIIGMLMILWPQFWKRLNPNCDFVRQIAEQTSAARHQLQTGLNQS